MENNQPSRRFLPRFSLLTILLVMALVACGITIWQLWREIAPLRVEIHQWRSEYGVLTIEDKSKMHAIDIRQNQELAWAWKVFVPAGQKADLYYEFENVPKNEFITKSKVLLPVLEGEHTIRCWIRQDMATGSWNLNVAVEGRGSSSRSIPRGWEWFLLPNSVAVALDGVRSNTVVAENDGKMLLLDHRAIELDQVQRNIPRQGFIVWLQQL
jgi:hypothetical protein